MVLVVLDWLVGWLVGWSVLDCRQVFTNASAVQSYWGGNVLSPATGPDWVSSHWAHFTVLRFIFVYVCIFCMTVYCMRV